MESLGDHPESEEQLFLPLSSPCCFGIAVVVSFVGLIEVQIWGSMLLGNSIWVFDVFGSVFFHFLEDWKLVPDRNLR